ncbi:ATP-grasp domain-containing protein, partial [Streptomyces calidiresistens]
MPVHMEGVDHQPGVELLHGLLDEIVWLDRSPFLAASAAAPGMPHVTTLPPGTVPRLPEGVKRAAVAFAPEHGPAARATATGAGLALLAPDPAVTALASDKIDSLPLFGEAGVSTPDHLVVPASGRADASSYRRPHWRAAVVQRRENNLVGRGTRHAGDREELRACMEEWPDRELRVTERLDGWPLTASGCVFADRTLISGLSYQVVGVPGLAPGWGTHCGNQLPGPNDLPGGTHRRVTRAARAIGEVLRSRGFRGVFGIDLVLTVPEHRVVAIEINPRFQTVVSLIQCGERQAGLLPALGAHVLALRGVRGLPVRTAEPPADRWGQFVVHAMRDGPAPVLPSPGRYRLTVDGHLSGPSELGAGLPDLGPDEALVWVQTPVGQPVREGDELLLVQLPGPVVDPHP